ncbi:MAG: hypothetical protein E6Q97_06790 [Desulfurellales bacterium]|nr:MAG: hypothetical protein E6Q97_06790 [Desulfurellales bacterium]
MYRGIKDVAGIVQGFMRNSGQFCQNKSSLRMLYAQLMQEEFEEWQRAGTEVEEFDACLDLIWVTVGFMIANGWNAAGGWEEVARSNMDKVKDGLVKDKYGKVQKPEGWTPPDLKGFLK